MQYSHEETIRHGTLLANRVEKRFRHLYKRLQKENIDCFRLYDWDIPEVRVIVDWYAEKLVVSEYERTQTGEGWLETVALEAAKRIGVAPENVFMKKRKTGSGAEPRYATAPELTGNRFAVRERALSFYVNVSDFLDTGLFSDHRNTRRIIQNTAAGKDFLNLFSYTGAFTCAAAAGNARSTVTVDRSQTYCAWCEDNLKLNRLWPGSHRIIQYDVEKFLEKAAAATERYDLVVMDPPSFFQSRSRNISFDINRDHPRLLTAAAGVIRHGGTLYFSTNHQRFEPKFEGLPYAAVTELTPGTIPEDYRNKKIHRCWRMNVL